MLDRRRPRGVGSRGPQRGRQPVTKTGERNQDRPERGRLLATLPRHSTARVWCCRPGAGIAASCLERRGARSAAPAARQ
ncbi:hypothetical protein NDU88_005830 [Pleurodeles waltl]|uniref:Uncharacterized protein n=1 Tax=Pleurodeles waltl TaxID=8319 RepID=A0AAV7UJB7_PLEWA|nr:hypothetical protein NDU88_005830 [Pleurodeles waltl]